MYLLLWLEDARGQGDFLFPVPLSLPCVNVAFGNQTKGEYLICVGLNVSSVFYSKICHSTIFRGSWLHYNHGSD